MKKTLLRLLLGMVCFGFIICPAWARNDNVIDGIAAIVGSDIILVSEIEKRQSLYSGRFQEKKKRTRGEILEELIEEKLLEQEMDRLELEASPEEIQNGIRAVLAQNRITLVQLKKELAAKGISFEAYKKDLADRIRVMTFMRQYIYSKVNVQDEDFELYRRRYPQKSKQQSKEEIRQAVLETKSRDMLKNYLRGVRERTYVEIKE